MVRTAVVMPDRRRNARRTTAPVHTARRFAPAVAARTATPTAAGSEEPPATHTASTPAGRAIMGTASAEGHAGLPRQRRERGRSGVDQPGLQISLHPAGPLADPGRRL